LIVVLDSNEYLGFLSGNSPFAEGLFGDEKVSIFIHELIVKEVLRNLQESIKGEFYTLLFTNNIQVFHGILHSSLLQKYRNLGLKKGDIVIAAFCEHVKAEYLITENRHFLKIKAEAFKVVDLKEFLTLKK